jgi:hypothetical protein
MFRAAALLALTAALAGATARADDNPVVPKTAPPEFVTVNQFDTGKEELIVGVVSMAPTLVTRTRNVVIMGKPVTENYVETKYVPVSRMVRKSTSGAKYLNGEGKPVDKASAIQMFKKGTVILWTESPDGVDPLYLKALSKDALIVIAQPVLPP